MTYKEKILLVLQNQLIDVLLKETDNIFNISLYCTIIELINLPRNIPISIAQELQKILNQMMNLHRKECIIVQTKPHYKQSQNILKQQQLFNIKRTYNFRHHNDQLKRSGCLLCKRGCILFNTIVNVRNVLLKLQTCGHDQMVGDRHFNYKKWLQFYFDC